MKSSYVYTKTIDEFGAALGIDVVTENYENGEIISYEIYDNDGALVRSISSTIGRWNLCQNVQFVFAPSYGANTNC